MRGSYAFRGCNGFFSVSWHGTSAFASGKPTLPFFARAPLLRTILKLWRNSFPPVLNSTPKPTRDSREAVRQSPGCPRLCLFRRVAIRFPTCLVRNRQNLSPSLPSEMIEKKPSPDNHTKRALPRDTSPSCLNFPELLFQVVYGNQAALTDRATTARSYQTGEFNRRRLLFSV